MDWKDACKKLQEKGLKFEFYCAGSWASNTWNFTVNIEDYRIAAQPIPDREDWRDWCRKLCDCGVEFESSLTTKGWLLDIPSDFSENKERYRIIVQPIPAGITKYLEEEMAEQKQDKLEIHHLEQQIQWHEDKLHSLRADEPMREWEYRLVVGDGEWKICNDPHFSEKYEYRRKPRTVTYWHCIVDWHSRAENKDVVDYLCSTDNKSEVKKAQESILLEDPTAKFSPIIETTVELED